MRKPLIFAVAAVVILTAAALNRAQEENQQPIQINTATAPTPPPPIGAAVRVGTENYGRYRIGLGDILEVDVFKHPEYKQTLRVEPHGTIQMPRINTPISVLCKTETDLARELTDYYRKYLRNPYVSVFVKEYYSQPAAVIGAVEKPGQFQITRRMRLLEALAVAGGPNDRAGAKVILARLENQNVCDAPTAAPGNAQIAGTGVEDADDDLSKLLFSYNLRRVMEGDSASNPLVRPGDVISILETEQAYIVGNVKSPKTLDLKEPITLTQAIAKAEGLLPASKTKNVKLIRVDPTTNKKQELSFDLTAISKHQAEDPLLQPNDIVEVPTDGKKKLRDKIVTALTGGLSSLPFLIP